MGVEATDAATGLRQTTVTLTNCGAKSLAVSGYPKLRLLDDHGRTVEVRVHHGDDIVDSVTDPGPATTTLRPGRQVIAILAWRNTYTESNEPPRSPPPWSSPSRAPSSASRSTSTSATPASSTSPPGTSTSDPPRTAKAALTLGRDRLGAGTPAARAGVGYSTSTQSRVRSTAFFQPL